MSAAHAFSCSRSRSSMTPLTPFRTARQGEASAAPPIAGYRMLSSTVSRLHRHRRRSALRVEATGGASSTGPPSQSPSSLQQLRVLAGKFTDLYPLWIALGCTTGMVEPSMLTWFTTEMGTAGLGITLLCMGFTLQLSKFADIVTNRAHVVGFGLALQWATMLALGFVVTRFAGLSTDIAVGLSMIAACPAGTSSNINCFIAQGDTALCVIMTSCSTLAAALTLPLFASWLAGALVQVNAAGLFQSTLQVVVAPVLLGTLLNRAFPDQVRQIAAFAPVVAVTISALTVSSTVARSSALIRATGLQMVVVIGCFHAAALASGYWGSRLAGLPQQVARTNAFQTSVRNGVLGAVLGNLHFNTPYVAAACSVSVCLQNVMAGALAVHWRGRAVADDEGTLLPAAAQ